MASSSRYPWNMTGEITADWERLLAAERHLQALVPGSVLVGGSAAALHAGHRVSMDGERFDDVLAPVLILGQLDGVLTGIRQLRRTEPLETEEIAGLQVPTLPEMARIKAWLLATRFTTRDYLDAVVLFERLGEPGAREALRRLDAIYAQPSGASVLAEVVERLGSAQPVDVAKIDLAGYRGLRPPWNEWHYVTSRGRLWAEVLADLLLRGKEGQA
jgi:hypothetical protein